MTLYGKMHITRESQDNISQYRSAFLEILIDTSLQTDLHVRLSSLLFCFHTKQSLTSLQWSSVFRLQIGSFKNLGFSRRKTAIVPLFEFGRMSSSDAILLTRFDVTLETNWSLISLLLY